MAKEHRHALPAGHEIEGYRIEKVLGAGGFGITYLAIDIALKRPVAIKEFLPATMATRADDKVSVHPLSGDDEEDFDYGLSRFRTEAMTLVSFQHSNIVPVYRFFEANGTAYLVMGYQDGEPLDAILKGGKTLPQDKLMQILMPLLEGLEKVHQAGFMHRDVKPANIFILEDGSPVLIDFGAARSALGEKSKSMTAIVSAGYAPFEQYSSRGNQGPWTDIYGLAATAYRAVTGNPPPESAARVEEDICVPASEAAKGDYDASFLDAIDRGIAVMSSDRPRSIAEWRAMLLGEADTARPSEDTTKRGAAAVAGTPPTVEKPPRPQTSTAKLVLVGLAAFAATAAVGGGGYFGWTEYKAEQNRRIATEAAKRRAAEARREAEMVARRREEERRRAEAERRRREADEETGRKRAEAERKRVEAERKKAEAERKRVEAGRRKAQEARRKKAEAAARRKAQQQARRRARDAARRRAAEARRKAQAKRRKQEALRRQRKGRYPYTLTIINNCRKRVSVAYRVRNNGRWTTRAWINVATGRRGVRRMKTRNRVVYLYARAHDGSIVWSARGKAGAIRRWIRSQSFAHSTGRLYGNGAKTVWFYKFQIRAKSSGFQWTLVCRGR